jgi:hypothetical protein
MSTYLHFEQYMLKNIIAHNVSNVFNINFRKEDYIGHFFFLSIIVMLKCSKISWNKKKIKKKKKKKT